MKFSCSLTLCTLLIALLLRLFPLYHPLIETNVAGLLDTWDEINFPFSEIYPPMGQMSAWIKEKVHVVNVGGHFDRYLSGEKKGNYFEGWYYKMVSEDQRKSVITITGAFFEKNNLDNHGFVMVGIVEFDVQGNIIRNEVQNRKFPLSEVSYKNFGGSEDKFLFKLGQNEFGNDFAKFNIPDLIIGQVNFTQKKDLPFSFLLPNIMGWTGYFKSLVEMQCIHKLVAIDSVVEGSVDVFTSSEKINVNLNNGQGYIEGDYGREFPSKYTWMQTNTFDSNPGSSAMLGFAKVPFPNEELSLLTIDGFMGYIYDAANNKYYRFGTYTGATAEIKSNISKNSSHVSVEVRDLQYIYSFTALGNRDKSLVLWGPRKNEENVLVMKRYVNEMLDAQIHVSVKRRSDGSIAFERTGTKGGLEVELY